MDEQAARLDVEKLRDLLESTTGKGKKQKGKTEEQRITFENLDQYPYVMRQSAWELDWDKVQALYCPHIGIPAFIIDNSIVAQWSSTVSPSDPQRWTDLEDPDTLYAHAVLFSLMPLNLLDAVEGREQGNFGDDPALFVYSAVVVFVHPRPSIDHHPECCRLLPASVWCHSAGWMLCWLVHSLQAAPLWDVRVLPRDPTYTVFGIAHVSTIWWPNCLNSALPRLGRLWCWLHDYMAVTLHVVLWHRLRHNAPSVMI